MKLDYDKKIPFSISFILIIFLNVFSQNVPPNKNVLPPPSEGLVAVYHPDLKNVETDVREQIIGFQQTLAETAKSTTLNAEKLSEDYGTMGQIYQAYSFLETAAECYTNASRLAPNDFRWVYLLGKVAAERTKTYEAIDFYKKTEKLRPDYPPIYVNLGNAHLELNSADDAEQAFENALKISPNYPAAIYGLGQVSYARGDFAKAVSAFEKVLNLVPDANRVHYSLALAYRGLKNVEKAKFHLSKQGAVGVRPDDPLFDGLNDLKKGVRLRLLRGKQAFEAGRFAEAEAEFQKVLAAEPENVPALVNYGATLTNLEKYAEAEKLFEKAVKLSPNNVNARYNLATLLALQKKHFQAISHLKAILKINPKDYAARFLLAKQLFNAELFQEALSELVNVYNANPDNEDVLLEFVKLLTTKGENKQAKELLEKSNQKFPTRGRTAAALAYLLVAAPQADLRDGMKALELSQQVFSATKLVEHGAIVAMAYAELGQCDAAAKLIKELLLKASTPENENLAAKLKIDLNRYENEKPCRIK